MSDDPHDPTPTCERCDDTGWTRHVYRPGYVWCSCAKGERFRTAHQALRAKRQAKAAKWQRAGDGWTRRTA